MVRTKQLVNVLRIVWILFLLNYEFNIFWFAAKRCTLWNKKNTGHYMLIGDPQITDDLSYQRTGVVMEVTKFISALYMKRNYRHLIRSLEPSDVFFMGDLMDHGRDWDEQKYEKEVDRFNKIFNSPQFKHYMAGNHDVGFGNGIRHERQVLFEKHFGKSSYIHHTTHGYAFVVIDTVALSSDDPVVRQEAMDVLSSPMPSSPRILMTHVPLWREPNSFCGPDRQAMDGGIRDGQGYQYKNLVSKELSDMILDRVQPVTVFSGDDHDYCQLVHRQEITEISVPTFSMAQGIQYPGVMLLDIADGSLSMQLCWLPNQVGIFITYAYLLVASLLVLAAFHTYQWSKRGHAHFPLKQEELAAIAPPPLSSRQYLLNFFKSVRDVALVAIPTYCFCISFL